MNYDKMEQAGIIEHHEGSASCIFNQALPSKDDGGFRITADVREANK